MKGLLMSFPTPDPIPAHQGPPASATPMRDYLASPRPGMTQDGHYVVVPREVLERLPLPLQQRITGDLRELHAITSTAPWPLYRVIAGRWVRIAELDETDLATVGITTSLDDHGNVVHQDSATGRVLSEQELDRYVVLTCADPLTRPAASPGV